MQHNQAAPARFLLIPILLIACLYATIGRAWAQADENPGAPLTVGLAECPPFVMLEGAQPYGLGVYLWEKVGTELGLDWKYTEFTLGELLHAIRSADGAGLPDVSISCTSVTAEREKYIDFSHSFHETYTAIAVRQTTLWEAIKGFFAHPRVFKALFVVLGLAVVIGLVFFLLEHRSNKKLFSHPTVLGRILEPLIIGLMFVSNGPIRYYRFKTLTARSLATILTLSSTFLIAAVTAILASSFTLDAMQTGVRSIEDLRNMQVGSLEASTSSALLDFHGIVHEVRPDLQSLVNDLDEGKLEAIVSDAAFLKFEINYGKRRGKFKALTVLPYKLEAQNYAFVLAENSALREPINRTLLSIRIREDWHDKIKHFLGD